MGVYRVYIGWYLHPVSGLHSACLRVDAIRWYWIIQCVCVGHDSWYASCLRGCPDRRIRVFACLCTPVIRGCKWGCIGCILGGICTPFRGCTLRVCARMRSDGIGLSGADARVVIVGMRHVCVGVRIVVPGVRVV